MTTYEVVYEKGAFSKYLTPQQRTFAEEKIKLITESADPYNYRDCDGQVEALNANLKGQFKYKPHVHMRLGHDLEIRIQFKPSSFRKFVIVVVRVFPREELYARR